MSFSCHSDSTLSLGRLAWRVQGRFDLPALQSLLQSDAIGHTSGRILSLEPLKLRRRVLVNELIDRKETATNLDLNLVTQGLHIHLLRAKLIDTGGLTHEHDLEFLAVRVVVDVLSQLLVDRIVLDRDVDSDTRLKVDDVLTQLLDLVVGLFDFGFVVFHLLEHLKLGVLRLVVLLLELTDVG